jgi:prepilin-type N-terminal cleavage/methylation domain-containing protein
MTRERRWRGQAGTTLVELLVALVVLAVGLALAAGLLIQSYRMLAQSGIEMRDPAAELAMNQLRADLQGASRVVDGSLLAGWSRDHLVLVLPGRGPVLYERAGDRLVRRARDDASGRTVLDGLVSWRWVEEAPRLVTVEVVYEGHARRSQGVVSPQGPVATPSTWHTRRLRVALRGGGLGRGW